MCCWITFEWSNLTHSSHDFMSTTKNGILWKRTLTSFQVLTSLWLLFFENNLSFFHHRSNRPCICAARHINNFLKLHKTVPCSYTNHDHPDKMWDFFKISQSEDKFRTMKWLHIFFNSKSAMCLEPSIPIKIYFKIGSGWPQFMWTLHLRLTRTRYRTKILGVSDKGTLCSRAISKFFRSFTGLYNISTNNTNFDGW